MTYERYLEPTLDFLNYCFVEFLTNTLQISIIYYCSIKIKDTVHKIVRPRKRLTSKDNMFLGQISKHMYVTLILTFSGSIHFALEAENR